MTKLIVLYVQVTVHRDNLRINNQQDASIIQNFYFVTKLYMFRASSVPIIRSYQPRVQLITPDDGHRICRKHVEFRDKIKLWIIDASCWLFIRRKLIVVLLNIVKSPNTHTHTHAHTRAHTHTLTHTVTHTHTRAHTHACI